MTLRDLQIFQAVAESGKMSVAAARLDIAQPTVSHVIANIEADYGIQLFERLSKRLYITSDGRQLLNYAKNILSMFNEMEAGMGFGSRPQPLRIGATITIGSSILAEIINQYEHSHPSCKTSVYVDNTSTIEHKLLHDQLDVALVEGVVTSNELVTKPVFKDALVLVCDRNHPFASRRTVQAQDLASQPFILRERGSGTRARFEQYLKKYGITVEEKWICHSSDAILHAVANGQGMTVISYRLAERQLLSGELHLLELRDADFSRTFNLVYHKDKYITASLEYLIDQLMMSRHDSPCTPKQTEIP